MNTYYKILNEIASVFDMDQWNEQVNLFTNSIENSLSAYKTDFTKLAEKNIGNADIFIMFPWWVWAVKPEYSDTYRFAEQNGNISFISNLAQECIEYVEVIYGNNQKLKIIYHGNDEYEIEGLVSYKLEFKQKKSARRHGLKYGFPIKLKFKDQKLKDIDNSIRWTCIPKGANEIPLKNLPGLSELDNWKYMSGLGKDIGIGDTGLLLWPNNLSSSIYNTDSPLERTYGYNVKFKDLSKMEIFLKDINTPSGSCACPIAIYFNKHITEFSPGLLAGWRWLMEISIGARKLSKPIGSNFCEGDEIRSLSLHNLYGYTDFKDIFEKNALYKYSSEVFNESGDMYMKWKHNLRIINPLLSDYVKTLKFPQNVDWPNEFKKWACNKTSRSKLKIELVD